MFKNCFIIALVALLPSLAFAQQPPPTPAPIPNAVTPAPVPTTPPVMHFPSASPLTVIPVGNPTAAANTIAAIQNEPLPDYDPNDPELNALWKEVESVQRERRILQIEQAQQNHLLDTKEREARSEFLKKIGERRIEELQSRRVTEKIDTTKTGLLVKNFQQCHHILIGRIFKKAYLDISLIGNNLHAKTIVEFRSVCRIIHE